MTSPADDKFFPTIGAAAQQTDDLADDEGNGNAVEGGEGDEERPLQEVESLCMNCGEQGKTRLLLTTIPYFKQVIIMSFRCDHCGTSNNEIQSASSVRDQGITYTLKVLSRDDLDRQLVKSASCTLTIPEYALTIPSGKGQLTTVEGILRDTILDLSADQPLRKIQDPKTFEAIEKIIGPLADVVADTDEEGEKLSDGTRERMRKERMDKPIRPFTLIMDDPSGDSFLEFHETMSDPRWAMRQYNRSREQNEALGLAVSEEDPQNRTIRTVQGLEEVEAAELKGNEEIFVFPGICSSCGRPLDTMMKKVVIPYFKDIIIMSTNCTACGYRDNEVKSGGAVSEQGRKITLKVEDSDDLARDILKSESCSFEIPEIGLALQAGTLGGRFTTLEGILTQVYEELSEKVVLGDSAEQTELQKDEREKERESEKDMAKRERSKFSVFLGNLKDVISASRPFTLILNDPLANSYLQNLYAPDPDPNMSIEVYDRTWEQNEELGLNDIRLEGYESEHEREVEEERRRREEEEEKE